MAIVTGISECAAANIWLYQSKNSSHPRGCESPSRWLSQHHGMHNLKFFHNFHLLWMWCHFILSCMITSQAMIYRHQRQAHKNKPKQLFSNIFASHGKLTTPKLKVSSLTETSPLKASGAMYADVPSTVVVGIVTVLLCCPRCTNPKSPSWKKLYTVSLLHLLNHF